jgi:hypothetical protein
MGMSPAELLIANVRIRTAKRVRCAKRALTGGKPAQ